METVRYTDATQFLDRVEPFLLEREAENNLVLGMAVHLLQRESPPDQTPLFYAVMDNGSVVGAALQIPSRRLAITDMPDEALARLAHSLADDGATLTGTIGPESATTVFTEAWGKAWGESMSKTRSMRIYRLDRLDPVPRVSGAFATAAEDEWDLLARWAREFAEEMNSPPATPPEEILNRIRNGSIVVWRDPEAVSMACSVRNTAHGAGVGMVYTLPAHRGKGYATAVVAALSERLLASGKQFCVLYTDLANPTSNSIYIKMGYRPVCDCAEYTVPQA